jgi:hypothetical protein
MPESRFMRPPSEAAMYQSLGFVEIPPYGSDLGGEIAFF